MTERALGRAGREAAEREAARLVDRSAGRLAPCAVVVQDAAAPSPPKRSWRRLPDWTALPPPDPRLRAVVIVPVRDEAGGLRPTLQALAGQGELDGVRRVDPRSFEVIVLANNCSDASAEVVRRFAARRRSFRLHVVEVNFPRPLAHVGHARGVLMDEACRRLERAAGDAGVILSTDGDTRVAPDWLAATLAEIASGAAAVGGVIELDGAQVASVGLARLARRDAAYQRLLVRLQHALDPDPADPWPRHHQHFGASLALTVAAYRAVGGLPVERFLEDEALYRALRLHDLPVRHSPRVRVVTSSRREGRVEVGLSWQLRAWSALTDGDQRADGLVGDPRDYAAELVLRRRFRDCWRAVRNPGATGDVDVEPTLQAIAAAWRSSPRWLAGRMRACVSFGAFWGEMVGRRMRLRPREPDLPPVPMRQAIVLLRELLGERRTQSPGRGARPSAVPSRPPRSPVGSKRSSR